MDYFSKKHEEPLTRCLIISLFLHLISISFFFSYNLISKNSKIEEQQIQADFIVSDFVDFSKKDDPIKSSENIVDNKILPQLPKKFKIKEEKFNDKELLTIPSQKKTPISSSSIQDLKKEKIIELTKKEAIRRLIREHSKREAKKKKKKEKIANLAKEIRSQTKLLKSSLSAINISGFHGLRGYDIVLKKWIQKFYTLPESYDYSLVKKAAQILLVLNKKGQIASVQMLRSSHYGIYDDILLKIIKRAEPFPIPSSENVGKRLIFSFAIPLKHQ